MSARRFSLASVLYVTTGGTPGLIDGGEGLMEVQALLSHMTGSPIYLHQIPRAADVCQKYLRDQYGWLSKMLPSDGQSADAIKLRKWLRQCEKERGESLAIRVLPGGVYHYMDPIAEFGHQLAEGRGATVAAGAAE